MRALPARYREEIMMKKKLLAVFAAVLCLSFGVAAVSAAPVDTGITLYKGSTEGETYD